jgi:cardiolipin synthase
MTPSQLPNAITVGRMVMALPLLWLLMNAAWRPALGLAVIAGLSDVVDGFLAKRFGWRSELGGLLDPLADKLLMSVCFFGLWWGGLLPAWLVVLVLARDVVIVAGAWGWSRLQGAFHAEPSALSKATTLAQLLLIAMVLAKPAGVPLWPQWIPPVALATAALTVLSGADYVWRFGRRAWRRKRGP